MSVKNDRFRCFDKKYPIFVPNTPIIWNLCKAGGHVPFFCSYMLILLMEEILHQLSLVVYPMIYKVLAPSKRWFGMGFLKHQLSADAGR